jgi:hypothetical protein
MSEKTKRRRGRPPNPESQQRADNLTLRIRPKTKENLELQATKSGRSASAEADLLLTQALEGYGPLNEALDLAFGSQAAGLILLLGHLSKDTGSLASFVQTRQYGHENWLNDPYAFDQVATAIATVLESLRPEGDISAPTSDGWPSEVASKFEELGKHVAERFLATVVGRGEDWKPQEGDFVNEQDSPAVQRVLPVRERLGDQLIKRIEKNIAGSKVKKNG